VIPRAGDRLHPLFARYSEQLLPALREALAQDGPLHETLAALDAVIIEEPELRRLGDPARLLFNVNTPDDLARAETMLDPDIESIRRGFDAFTRGDIGEMLAFASPDVIIHDAPELPGGSVHRGREAVGQALEEMRGTFKDLEVQPETFTRVGDRILVVFRATGRGAASGIPIDLQLANILTMRDGLLTEWHSYTSEAQAREALDLD
jgi:ketosteroid isomerase-like protein